MDRLYNHRKVFSIHATSLEAAWVALGGEANGARLAQTGGEGWVWQVVGALGVPWPLTLDQPAREAQIQRKPARAIWSARWALKEEVGAANLVRADPE